MFDDFDRGRLVGKYEILARLSVGGMAELYLAFLPGPGGFRKFVALKQILPEAREDEQFVKLFLDEARITASLSHPNIAQVFDLGSDELSDELYLAMEYIPGQDLSVVIRAAAAASIAIPVPIICRIVRDTCLALGAAHTFVDPGGDSQPIIHRDVSPKNVMVSWAGHVKVIDFGIAKAKGRLAQTRTGQLRGTLSYMAPEQVTEQAVDARTDLFAVGIVLHELLCGERLYPSGAPGSLWQMVHQAAVDPCLKNPLVPPALGALTLKALAKPPDERFQTGKAFARALEEACPGLADDDEVAGFMGELFGEQLRASRALFEAAAHDANTAELHGLASLLSPQGLAPVEAVTQSHTDRPATAGLMTPLMRPKVSPRPPAVELSKAMTEPLEHVTEMARPPVPRRTGVVALVVAASLAAVLGVVVFALKAPPPAEPPNLPAVPFQRPAAEVALARGERALAAKDAAGAAQAFAEVLGKDPTNWTALFGAGVAARQLRDDAQARKRLEEAVNRAPEPKDAARALFELACVQARSGDAAGALAGLQRAIGLVGVAPFAERLQSEPDLAALRGTAGFKRLRLRPSAGVE